MATQAIVIVDDEAILLFSLKQTMRLHFGEKYRYETAMNGEKGLECMNELLHEGVEVVLVISDWLMPGMNGAEFLRTVHREYPTTNLLMISGHADEVEIDKLTIDLGLQGFLRKPWNRRQLFDTVESALNRYTDSQKNVFGD